MSVTAANVGARLLSDRLSRVRSALECPACQSELVDRPAALECPRCDRSYPIRNGQIHFIAQVTGDDDLDALKGRLKRVLGRLYYSIGVRVFGPSYPFNFRKEILSRVDPATCLVVDLGAGNHRIDNSIVTVDCADYAAVDIVADLAQLPFRSDSIDAFTSSSVLEHVADLDAVIAQVTRCTRSNGLGIHHTPFLFPYHASPDDFRRFTHSGIANLFNGWDLIAQRNVGGPVSLLLLVSIELASTLLSFGSNRLKRYVYLGLCGLLFWVKYLDAPFIGRRAMLSLAPTMVTTVRKPPAD
jgi:hypothetical protein